MRLFIPRSESLENLPHFNFDIVRGDIRNKKDVQKAVKNVSIVYHLAALTIDGNEYFPDKDYFDVNVKGAENLLDAIRDKRIKKFILLSLLAPDGANTRSMRLKVIVTQTSLWNQLDFKGNE